MFAVQGIGKMIGQVVKKALPFVILLGVYFYLNHEGREADSRFRAQMEKEIQYIAKDLEKTGLPKETAEIIEDALHRVKWWVRSSAGDKFDHLFTLLFILALYVYADEKKKEANAR